MTTEEAKSKYDTAAAQEKAARIRLAGITEKHEAAGQSVDRLAGEFTSAKQAAETVMQDYLVGKASESDLAAARRAAESVDALYRDSVALTEAIGEALKNQLTIVKDAKEAATRARNIFWQVAANAEKQAVRQLAEGAIRRALVLAIRTAPVGSAYRVTPIEVMKNILEGFSVSDDQRATSLAELAKEYGVPMN